jgi:hypothetical protein
MLNEIFTKARNKQSNLLNMLIFKTSMLSLISIFEDFPDDVNQRTINSSDDKDDATEEVDKPDHTPVDDTYEATDVDDNVDANTFCEGGGGTSCSIWWLLLTRGSTVFSTTRESLWEPSRRAQTVSRVWCREHRQCHRVVGGKSFVLLTRLYLITSALASAQFEISDSKVHCTRLPCNSGICDTIRVCVY